MKLNPISTGALGFCLWAAMMLLIKYPQGWLSLTSTPVHTFHVDLHEHGILLFTVMGVSWLITYLLRRQKQIAEREHALVRRTLQLMRWSEQLREA